MNSPRAFAGCLKIILYVAQMLIGDAFMVSLVSSLRDMHSQYPLQIYRAYVLWNSSWRVISLPLMLLLSEIGTSFSQT